MTGFIVETNERSAGLWMAYVEGANTDDALAAAYARRMDVMRADGRRVLDLTVSKGLCPAPVDPGRTVDAVWVVLHPSQYVLLVSHAGWERASYHSWMHQAVLALLTA